MRGERFGGLVKWNGGVESFSINSCGRTSLWRMANVLENDAILVRGFVGVEVN